VPGYFLIRGSEDRKIDQEKKMFLKYNRHLRLPVPVIEIPGSLYPGIMPVFMVG
jgi:hypothetical protein